MNKKSGSIMKYHIMSLLLLLAVTTGYSQLEVTSENGETLYLQVEENGITGSPAQLTVSGKTVTSQLQLRTGATQEHVAVSDDNQGNVIWGQVTSTAILDQTILKQDLSYYRGIDVFTPYSEFTPPAGEPLSYEDTNLNQEAGRVEWLGPSITFEPGVYLFTFVSNISFKRTGMEQYHPQAWIRLYNTEKNEFYAALHTLSGDNESAGEHSGKNVVIFTETTTVQPKIVCQEGVAYIWYNYGHIAKALRLF